MQHPSEIDLRIAKNTYGKNKVETLEFLVYQLMKVTGLAESSIIPSLLYFCYVLLQ